MTGRDAKCPALLLAALALPLPVLAAQLDIELAGIENDHGLVRVAVCTPATFTTRNCPFTGAEPGSVVGSVVVSVPDIPPGRYAVQAYHDEDGNGRLRRRLFGCRPRPSASHAMPASGSGRPASRTRL